MDLFLPKRCIKLDSGSWSRSRFKSLNNLSDFFWPWRILRLAKTLYPARFLLSKKKSPEAPEECPMMCNHTVGASLGSFCKSVLRCLDQCFEEAMCFTKNTRNTKWMFLFRVILIDVDWLFIHGRQTMVGKCCICRFHLNYLHTHISEIHIRFWINIWLYQPSCDFLVWLQLVICLSVLTRPGFWFLTLPIPI